MKILLLDIETAPNLAYVWGLWEQNVALTQLVEQDYLLCWAAKWYGEDKVIHSTVWDDGKYKMMKDMWKLLDEADAVVHYNGKKFDIPWINREMLLEGMLPPSPYRQIDLLETVKKTFRFPSNKLEFVAKELGVGKKINTNFELWVGCIKGDKESREKMSEYNVNDTILLERVYEVLLPWIKGHANHALFSDGSAPICPNCGSDKLHKRGLTHTLASVFQRYRCTNCGHWSKDSKRLNSKQYKTTSIAL